MRPGNRRRNDDVLAGETGVEALADVAFEDEQTSRLVLLAGREDFLDLGAAEDRLDDFRTQPARHRPLHPGG